MCSLSMDQHSTDSLWLEASSQPRVKPKKHRPGQALAGSLSPSLTWSLLSLSAAETHQNKSRHQPCLLCEQPCVLSFPPMSWGWLAERVGSLQQFSLGLLPHNPPQRPKIRPSHWSSRSPRFTLIGRQPQNTFWLCLIYGKSLNPAWKRFPPRLHPCATNNGRNDIAGQDEKGLPLFLLHCIKIKKWYKWKSCQRRMVLLVVMLRRQQR